MAKILKARVFRNIGSESEWLVKNPVLMDGEVAYVRFGSRIRTKVGDGSLSFGALSYQDSELKVSGVTPSFPFVSGEGPAPEGIYMAKESGVYNGNVVVDVSGKIVFLLWDGVNALEKIETLLPPAINKTLPWTGATPAGEQRLYNGQLWTASIATLEEDVPGISGKWLPELNFAKIETETIYGKNRFNKAAVTPASYINYQSGNIAPNSSYSASDFIFIEDISQITISRYTHIAFYNSSKVFIIGYSFIADGSTADTPKSFIKPEAASFMRLSNTNSNINTQQVESGSETTAYVPYTDPVTIKSIPVDFPAQAITNELRASILNGFSTPNNSITPQKTTFAKYEEFFGKNRFNKNVPVGNIGKYVNWTNGALAGNPSYSTSDFITIKSNFDYTFTRVYFFAWYDKNKVFIGGIRNDITPGGTFKSPANGKFLIASTNNVNAAQVEEGTVKTEYEPYKAPETKVVIPDLYIGNIPEPVVEEVPDVFIPSEIYLTEGLENNIYFKNAVVPGFADRLENYEIDVSGQKGFHFDRMHRYTPAIGDAGSYILMLEVFKGLKIVNSVTTMLRVAAKNAANGITIKILLAGDSTVDGNDVTIPLKAHFDTDVTNIEFVGTRGGLGLKHEGFSGWTIKDFATAGRSLFRFNVTDLTGLPSLNDTYTNNGSTFKVVEINLTDGTGYFSTERTAGAKGPVLTASTLVKSTGTGAASISYNTALVESANPFWNPVTERFDFAKYLADTGQTMSAGDWFFFQLGINDMFSSVSIEEANTRTITMWVQLKGMMDNIQEVVPGIRIGVAGTIPPSGSQDAFGFNYSNNQSRERYFKTGWKAWHRKLMDEMDNTASRDSKRYLLATHLNLDVDNNFPKAEYDANSRNSVDKVTMWINGVHPDVSGYAQMADIYIGAIKYFG